MNLSELPILPNGALFIQLFNNYTRLLDLYGSSLEQDFPMSNDAFKELKDFIKDYDQWDKNNSFTWPYLGRFIRDNEPMSPKLESETPFMLIDGYKFNIKINQ